MRFPSKIDTWWYLVLGVLGALTLLLVADGLLSQNTTILWVAAGFILFDGAIVLPLWLATYYTLEEHCLHIRSGSCFNLRIPYEDILRVESTRNPFSSAALSLDRLDVVYRVKSAEGHVLISPKEKAAFLQELAKRTVAKKADG